MAISERRRFTFMAIAVALVGIITGLFMGGVLLPSTTPPTVEVAIVGDSETSWAFNPATITVPVGTTVVWVHRGTGSHIVVSDAVPALFRFKYYLTNGGTDSITFTQPGIFGYHCFPHPVMKGEIIVF